MSDNGKICSKCKKFKEYYKFYEDIRSKDGFYSWCIDCFKGRNRLEDSLMNNHGITLMKYNLILKKQNGVCAICGKKETQRNQFSLNKLSVDHCHKTNKIRGLLCHKCNKGLGLFDDNIEYLKSAIIYLRQNL